MTYQNYLDTLTAHPELVDPAIICITIGGGTIFPQEMKIAKEKFLALELEDGENLAGAEDWHYETAILVKEQNIEKLKKIARDIFSRSPRCPYCGWHSRLKYRSRSGDYICHNCGKGIHI